MLLGGALINMLRRPPTLLSQKTVGSTWPTWPAQVKDYWCSGRGTKKGGDSTEVTGRDLGPGRALEGQRENGDTQRGSGPEKGGASAPVPQAITDT